MNKYKLDINRISILCDIYKSEYLYAILTTGIKRLEFCPRFVGFNLSTVLDGECYGEHLPILMFYNSNTTYNEVIAKDLPRLEFVVGKAVKE